MRLSISDLRHKMLYLLLYQETLEGAQIFMVMSEFCCPRGDWHCFQLQRLQLECMWTLPQH